MLAISHPPLPLLISLSAIAASSTVQHGIQAPHLSGAATWDKFAASRSYAAAGFSQIGRVKAGQGSKTPSSHGKGRFSMAPAGDAKPWSIPARGKKEWVARHNLKVNQKHPDVTWSPQTAAIRYQHTMAPSLTAPNRLKHQLDTPQPLPVAPHPAYRCLSHLISQVLSGSLSRYLFPK